MKRIFVDAFTFEVARALDRDLSERFGDEFAATSEQQRLVAVLLALTDWGFLAHDDQRREASFCFGPVAKPLGAAVPDERLIELATHKILIVLTTSEMRRSIGLSKQYCADLDVDVIEQSWKGVGAIIDLIVEGSLRLMGPASKGGLIAEHLTRSIPGQKCYVWFSLGNRACEEPIMVDLAEPLIFEGHHRFPVKANGQLFVTLGSPTP
ncbi:hypothetical protein [Bradyrhizobium icense]|uniref:Uncharacterized protein n=1 Tax=Bradyrhizobium icense TaxID=1274631 RepID=A0A1B1UBI9_9BRAD|nr:hypothetical protein [Bradyrhizobium icense]ANW00091.1 hypothetical protein LMTR13_07735 [Bradyrhizobium icense]